jgi:hypothetical protein
MAPELGEIPAFMKVAFGVFAVIFVLAVAFSARTALRSRKILRDHGLDPYAAQAEIAVRLAQGPLGTPAKGLEHRLVELDDLHRRGLISGEEHSAARHAALTDQP